MKRRFLHDISINTLQLVITQSCGLIIFYLLSTRLDKEQFGEMNWALAVLLTAFGVLGFGIDQVVVRRIAAGASAARMLQVYLVHACITGFLFAGLLWISALLFPGYFLAKQALLLLCIGKLMIFLSTTFKQIAAGLEKFRAFMLMAIVSNVLRAFLLTGLAVSKQLDFVVAISIFVITDLAELLACMLITRWWLKIPFSLKWDGDNYRGLIKEALPQFGVTVFSAALSRLDWIFLGMLAGNMILAEYSFAYKVFEMATLPLLVIAPLLIPRFTKYFHPGAAEITETRLADIFVLLRLEIIIASLVTLLLNIVWVPVIDLLTGNKYGTVNQNTILILSLSMPLLYYNNFLWTVNFAKGRQKMIFYVFLTSFVFNLAGDLILIPVYGSAGAAVAYLVAICIQAICYFKNTSLPGLSSSSLVLVFSPLAAVGSYLIVTFLFNPFWLQCIIALPAYFLLLSLTGQLRFSHWQSFMRITGL